MLATIRLISGLVLFAYVGTHLINHSWGLASMEALNIGRDVFVTVWRSWPGTILLYSALLTHFILILWSLYNRRSFRVRVWEAAQILLGLAIPFLLAEHVLGTRGLNATLGVIDDYIFEILVLWVYAPEKGVVRHCVAAWLRRPAFLASPETVVPRLLALFARLRHSPAGDGDLRLRRRRA